MVEFVRRRKRPCQQASFFFFVLLLLVLILQAAPVFAQQPAAANNNDAAAKPATKPEATARDNNNPADILPVVPPPKWYMSLFSKMDMNHDGLLDQKEYESGRVSLEQAMADHAATTTTRPFWFSAARGFWKAFTSSITMIIATEIGDKTFFIAAVLSMKHSRSAVFGGAIVALIVMTVLSTAMGLVLPKLIPRRYTHIVGGLLFLYFGIKLVAESRTMEAGKTSEELQEVEEELSCRKKNDQDGDDVESAPASGLVLPASAQWYSVAWQALSLTFLAEWGDRSQIATVALAASKNPVGVTIGGCLGHALCTGMAVIGGRMLASRISEKTVSQYGGLIFLLFGFHSLFLEE